MANALLIVRVTSRFGKSASKVIAEAVTKGVISADEGRAQLGLGPIDGGYGKVPATQQQQVPLDLLHQLHSANIGSKLAAQQPPPADGEPQKVADPAMTKALVIDIRDRMRKKHAN